MELRLNNFYTLKNMKANSFFSVSYKKVIDAFNNSKISYLNEFTDIFFRWENTTYVFRILNHFHIFES